MIRPADAGDMERIVEMALRFIRETKYREFVHPSVEKITQTVVDLLSNPNAVILVSGSDASITGMLGLMAFEHPFSGDKTATEVVWWVDPEARGDGLRLLFAGEQWCRANDVVFLNMVAPTEQVAGIYERLKYRPVEMMYQKAL